MRLSRIGRLCAALIVVASISLTGCFFNKRVYLREEFQTVIYHKTKAQMKELLGPPESTAHTAEDTDTWTWEKITKDPDSGKVDFEVEVDFTGGIVNGVKFLSG